MIRDSSEARDLLRLPETAQKAMEAWELIHAYRLPIRTGQFTATEDCSAFLSWTKEFERRRNDNGWLEQARLPDQIAALLAQGKLTVPKPVYLAGFDEFTPQQKTFFDAIGETIPVVEQSAHHDPVRIPLRDHADEIRHAAAWAQERLSRNPEARIDVIVPGLARLRSMAERAFTSVLHPSLATSNSARLFHISLGAPLLDAPVVPSGVFGPGSGNGRSPSLAHGLTASQPVHCRSGWRALAAGRAGPRNPSARALSSGSRDGPQRCGRGNNARIGAPIHRETATNHSATQSPGEWSRTFSRILRYAGWPGDRTLSSEEYQTVRAWNGVLSNFATLDPIIPRLDFAAALDRLTQLAQSTPFQPEDEGAPVQVMGLFESSGLHFDHLWVTGLHDEALPSPARPNPFLPLDLQKANGLPHSSPARELDVAHALMARLLKSAPELVLSYPLQEGDQQLDPARF